MPQSFMATCKFTSHPTTRAMPDHTAHCALSSAGPTNSISNALTCSMACIRNRKCVTKKPTQLPAEITSGRGWNLRLEHSCLHKALIHLGGHGTSIGHVPALHGVWIHADRNQGTQLIRVKVAQKGRVVAFNYLLEKGKEVIGVIAKWALERCHLVEQATS